MKITEFQLKIVAGYILSYLRWTKKLESGPNAKYEREADKTIACVSDMLALIRGKNVSISNAFDNIDISVSDDSILEQIKNAIESLN